jgi:hypothetical protein
LRDLQHRGLGFLKTDEVRDGLIRILVADVTDQDQEDEGTKGFHRGGI